MYDPLRYVDSVVALYRKFPHTVLRQQQLLSPRAVNTMSSIVSFVDLHTVVPEDNILLMLHLD